MITLASRSNRSQANAAGQRAIIDFLRAMVLGSPIAGERFHAVFLDQHSAYLGDAPLGEGGADRLSVRMRHVFAKALSLDASGLIIAHNHPSGHCLPSQIDIDATARLKTVAKALDLELLDHLIFTQNAVYSMRAGGKL